MKLRMLLERLHKSNKANQALIKATGRGLKKEIAAYISASLPEGMAVEWTQSTPWSPSKWQGPGASKFRVNPPALFDIKSPDITVYLDDAEHGIPIPGLTRKQLRKFADAWGMLPEELLLKAYGDGRRIRIDADSQVAITEYPAD